RARVRRGGAAREAALRGRICRSRHARDRPAAARPHPEDAAAARLTHGDASPESLAPDRPPAGAHPPAAPAAVAADRWRGDQPVLELHLPVPAWLRALVGGAAALRPVG